MLRLIKQATKISSLNHSNHYCIFESYAQSEFNREDEESQKLKKLLKSFESKDSDLTPESLVEYLDRFVIGQSEAKRAIACAFRNRWRRR